MLFHQQAPDASTGGSSPASTGGGCVRMLLVATMLQDNAFIGKLAELNACPTVEERPATLTDGIKEKKAHDWSAILDWIADKRGAGEYESHDLGPEWPEFSGYRIKDGTLPDGATLRQTIYQVTAAVNTTNRNWNQSGRGEVGHAAHKELLANQAGLDGKPHDHVSKG